MHVLDGDGSPRGVGHREVEAVAGGVVSPERGLAVGPVFGPGPRYRVHPEERGDAPVARGREEPAADDGGRRAARLELRMADDEPLARDLERRTVLTASVCCYLTPQLSCKG